MNRYESVFHVESAPEGRAASFLDVRTLSSHPASYHSRPQRPSFNLDTLSKTHQAWRLRDRPRFSQQREASEQCQFISESFGE